MMEYVAGFLFSSDGEKVAFIHKECGPDAVVGRWNAIGGKILTGQDEKADVAMRREFLEETGTDVVAWTLFLVLKGADWQVSFFHENYERKPTALAVGGIESFLIPFPKLSINTLYIYDD